jgi:hypothetical protein
MAGTRRRIASLAIAAGLAVTAGTAIALVGIGPASAFAPGEGTGKVWCSRYGGTSLGSYRDVYACKPGGKTAGKTPFDSYAGFQPTELANRYLYAVTGHTLFDNDVAGNFVALASASFALPQAASGPHAALPVPGDVISMWGGRSKQRENGDHTQVAIVTAVAAGPAGWVITTLNQGDPSDTPAARGFDSIAVSRNRKTWSALTGFYADFAWLKLAKPGHTSSPAPAPTPAPVPATGWQAAQAPGQGTAPGGPLTAVACATAGSCAAVGTSGGAAVLETRAAATSTGATSTGATSTGATSTGATSTGVTGTATGTGATWTPVAVPKPASATSSSSLTVVTCPAAAVCLAGGSYRSAGQQQGLLLSGHDRSWTATTAPLPANAAAAPQARISALACASAITCVAVGQYAASTSRAGLLITGHGSAWSGRAAPLPADAGPQPDATLVSVACPAVTSCTAAGSYVDGLGNRQGMLVLLRGTGWSAVRAPLPPDAKVPGATLTAVACPSTTSCVAVGSYSGATRGFAVASVGTSWTAAATPVPAGAAMQAKASFRSIACGTGGCVAVGSYTSADGSTQGLLVTGQGTVFTAVRAALPADAAPAQGSPGAQLTSVSCPSATWCVAAGTYTDAAGEAQTLLLSRTASAWTAVKAPSPANARTVGSQAQGSLTPPTISSVACWATASCVAVGGYPARNAGMAGLILTGGI